MSLSKKNTRNILIDGQKYRYKISRSKPHNNGVFSISITIECDTIYRSILSVKGLFSRDYWLDFPNISSNLNDYLTICSKDITLFIKDAIKQGWKPLEKSQVFEIKIERGNK